MNTTEYLEKVKQTPDTLAFSELMEVIENEYEFTPTAFTNGDIQNAKDENLGSCKIFSFSKFHGLSEAQTLACFGEYYRNDVLLHPEGDDHSNIRSFIQYGWAGITFAGTALTQK